MCYSDETLCYNGKIYHNDRICFNNNIIYYNQDQLVGSVAVVVVGAFRVYTYSIRASLREPLETGCDIRCQHGPCGRERKQLVRLFYHRSVLTLPFVRLPSVKYRVYGRHKAYLFGRGSSGRGAASRHCKPRAQRKTVFVNIVIICRAHFRQVLTRGNL